MSEIELHTGILKKVNTKGLSPEDWCREQVLFIDPMREKYDFEKWSMILEEYDNIGKYLVTATDVYEIPNLIVTSVIYIRILMEHILM